MEPGAGRERYRGMDIIRIILALLLPPVGVFLQVGFGAQFWINVLLTLLGYIPGMIHALYVIVKYKDRYPA
ncbi:UPF0057 membrane protein YqaE [Azospirillum argentinense]